MTEPRPRDQYTVGGHECRCDDCQRKRDEIEALMWQYETRALSLMDHRGIAAAHQAHALRLVLHILDGTTPPQPQRIVAPLVQPSELCAWPADAGCST